MRKTIKNRCIVPYLMVGSHIMNDFFMDITTSKDLNSEIRI